jgi:hypothetical protein
MQYRCGLAEIPNRIFLFPGKGVQTRTRGKRWAMKMQSGSASAFAGDAIPD